MGHKSLPLGSEAPQCDCAESLAEARHTSTPPAPDLKIRLPTHSVARVFWCPEPPPQPVPGVRPAYGGETPHHTVRAMA